MANTNDVSLQTIYHTINQLQSKMIKNSQDIVKISAGIQLATPKQISNILININNLQHETSILDDKLKDIQNRLNQLNGKFNQSILKTNEVANKLSNLKKSIQDSANKFFSWSTCREIIIGVILAALLYILRWYLFYNMGCVY